MYKLILTIMLDADIQLLAEMSKKNLELNLGTF